MTDTPGTGGPQPEPPPTPPTEQAPWGGPAPSGAAPPYGGYPQATGPPGTYVDPVSGLVLPAGVTLASAGRRIGAYFLSLLLFIVTLVVGYLIWGLIVWGRGTTPALQVLGMRCWRPDTGRVAGWWWMALREIIGRLVEGILGIITGAISFILMLSTTDRRTLHDMIAGTVVVYDPDKVLDRPTPAA